MSITHSSLKQPTKRHQSLRKLNNIFNKIQFLQLTEEDFSTHDLQQLSHYADYSIHPVFSSKQLYQIYLKLSQKYWLSYENIETIAQTKRVKHTQSIIKNDQTLEAQNNQINLHEQIQNTVQQDNQIEQISESQENEKLTETFLTVKQVRLQQKVTKSYHQIQQFLLQFDYQTALQNQKNGPKIQLLNSWTSVPCKLPNFIQKKSPQNINRIDSATYLENLKIGKQFRKDSTTSLSSLNTRSIILGKNESTQTKQMKHMLKVQAKTNFVQEKQKQESKLNILEKKSIELTYLLNVITKEFFNDFYSDILKILKENVGSVEILCQKIIQKVKEQHNFIQIYVELIKRLCKSSLSVLENESQKFNELQVHFVSVLQKSFTKLIQSSVEPSTSNFNEYKYQKQMVGMSQFIGKLIKQKVLSRKIFKVCFWQIIYRYVQKVKQNQQQQIVNECLIQAIVTVADSMGNIELLKLIQKQKQNQRSKQMDEVIEINKFQQMMMALVEPNDEDHVKREEEYNNLIESIKVEEYPHILAGLMQIFVSKRMKLKFLIQNWQEKIETLKNSNVQELNKMEQNSSKRQQQTAQVIFYEVQEDLIQYDKQLKQFVKQMKHNPTINNLVVKVTQSQSDKQLIKYETMIKKYIQSQVSQQSHSRKVLKLLIIQFLKQFADCKDHNVGIKRIDYFISFVDSLRLKDSNKLLLDIICEDQLQNLMIIECDYPFLVEGLCHLLMDLVEKVPIKKEKILQQMRRNFDQEDEDMIEFYAKVSSCISKLSCCQGQRDEVLED